MAVSMGRCGACKMVSSGIVEILRIGAVDNKECEGDVAVTWKVSRPAESFSSSKSTYDAWSAAGVSNMGDDDGADNDDDGGSCGIT